MAPRLRTSQPAVIVAIDDASLARYGQWPWPRTTLARLLVAIADGRPAAVGIDILMSEADRLSLNRVPDLVPGLEPDLAQRLARLPGNDATLGATLARMPVVVVVAGVDRQASAGAIGPRTPFRVHGGDPQAFVRRFGSELRSVREIDGAAAGHGLVNPDSDAGVVRRLPLVAAVGDELMPTLGIEMLRVAAGVPTLSVVVGRRGLEGVGIGDLVVPTDRDGTVWIHYAPIDPARYVSAGEVLAGRADTRQFERKLVLVGVTAVGLGDRNPTPIASTMPGVEIHTQLIENIFDGTRLVRPRWAPRVEAAILVIGGVLLILLVPAMPVRRSALVGVAVVLAAIAIGFLAYARYAILLDGAVPAAGLALVFSAVLGVTLAEAEGQRRALRRQLADEREAAAKIAGELEAARRIQMGILPSVTSLSDDHRVSLYAFLESARVVGGDLYDFFRLGPDRLFFMVGDVSGKGVPGSLFMAVSKALCKSSALRRGGDLAATMGEANAEISRDNAEALFVTAWAGVLDVATGHLDYCNAGHEPAWLLGNGGSGAQRLADGGGPPLCVIDDFPYEAASHVIGAGQMICLVTDGVTEAMNAAGELYGRQRLEAVLAAVNPKATAPEVGEAIRADVARFAAGAEASDDLTILIVRWHGPGAPSPSTPSAS